MNGTEVFPTMFEHLRSVLGRWPRAVLVGRGRPAVRVISRVSLTATHSVHVVELDGERLLLGCHPNGFLVLRRDEERQP